MAFADKYRKNNGASFGSQYRKDASGRAPIARAAIIPKKVAIQDTEKYKRAASEASRFAEEAKKANSFSGIAKETGKGVVKSLAEYLPKTAVSLAETPGTFIRGRAKQKTYNLPVIGDFKSYQSDAEDTANDIIEGKKPLYAAAKPFVELPLNFLPLGLKKPGANIASSVAPSIRLPGRSQIAKIAPEKLNIPTGIKPRSQALETALPSTPSGQLDFSSYRKSAIPETKGQGASLTINETPQAATLDEIAKIIPEGSSSGKFSGATDIMRSGRRVLENQGTAGKKLASLIDNEQVTADLKMGEWKANIKKETAGLDDIQKNNLTDVLEGKADPLDDVVDSKAKNLRTWLDSVQQEAVDTGLNTGKLENYFPRKYNWDEITKGKRKEEILQHMVDSGQASTKAEADHFLNTFIGKNRERKSGNLEFERMFDIPGYERDPEKALSMYAESAASRITEAQTFGKKDEVVSALINKIADGGGDYKQAQKVFDNVFKGEDKNAFAQFLLGYNVFTKLSLSFFSNLTQSVNTATKAGLLNTVKGAGQALAQGIKATTNKNYDDLAVLANTLDDHVAVQESGLSNKFIQSSMYLFQKVENFNRRTATYAGANRAKELAGMFAKDPQSAFASRQLKSLGIDVEDVVNGTLTEKQLAAAANKMTRVTQFKLDSMNLPTAWRTPFGKVLSQFKSFSFMQTKFIRDEILKEAKQGNFAPLVRFMSLAPIASYATQSMRNAVNANDKNDPSFRELDLYRKAIGDIPTDLASQLQYANEKSDKWYTTPLRNVKNYSSPFIGPTGGDVLELASSLEQKGKIADQNEMWYSEHLEAQKDPNLDLKRFVTSKVPFIGRRAVNQYLPYEDTTAKKAKNKAIEAIQKQDWKLLEEAQQEDPYLRKQRVFSNVLKEAGKGKMTPADKQMYQDFFDKVEKKKPKPFFQ